MDGRLLRRAGGVLVMAVAAATLAYRHRQPDRVDVRTPAPNAYSAVPYGRDGPAGDCLVCHSIERNGPERSAPGLWGIVGAPKARADWFAYSPPLRRKGGVWTAADLDRFLADPSAFVPGTSMSLPPIRDPVRREAIVAFLATLR